MNRTFIRSKQQVKYYTHLSNVAKVKSLLFSSSLFSYTDTSLICLITFIFMYFKIKLNKRYNKIFIFLHPTVMCQFWSCLSMDLLLDLCTHKISFIPSFTPTDWLLDLAGCLAQKFSVRSSNQRLACCGEKYSQ